mmetsp:Transcript_16362/g.27494  ORF Transcript_16362/g.27494 Transcript_16362/m.27494 type:complete len:270 (-) Transcript_16362:498-1307(-)
MGAVQSSEGDLEHSGDLKRFEDRPSSTESEYIPGTNLPMDGWLQPCSSCATTTARTVMNEHKNLIGMCRRCALSAGMESSQNHNDKRWEGLLQTEEPCNAVTATEEELDILEQYPYGFSFFNEEVALDCPGTILGCASHVERVDVLCNAIIGEMLIDDSPRLNHEQLAAAKFVVKSPRGVAEAAEMWSDLDTTDDSGCEWSSPRKGKERKVGAEKQIKTKSTEETDTSGNVLVLCKPTPQQERGSCSLTDSLYPHDMWHWNCQTSALLM